MCLWKENHKECKEACMKKNAAKLAYICRESTAKMMDVVKANPDMKFRELMAKCCKERGINMEHNSSSEESDSDSDRRRKGGMRDRPYMGMPGSMGRWEKVNWDDNSSGREIKQEPKKTPTETPNSAPAENAKPTN